jgi:hypothetical protein
MESKMAKYELTVRNELVTAEARDLDEMIQMLEGHVAFLKGLKMAGVKYVGGLEDDCAKFETDDRTTAIHFGFSATDDENDDLPWLVSRWGWHVPGFFTPPTPAAG